VQRIGVEERRARLARRHRLVAETRAASPLEVAGSLVALHSTDAATVFLSTWALTYSVTTANVIYTLSDALSLLGALPI